MISFSCSSDIEDITDSHFPFSFFIDEGVIFDHDIFEEPRPLRSEKGRMNWGSHFS